ncbi:MAG: protein kinase [Candidatus Saccharimonas sp.]|nr:protein kinase [Planctomycetaceae bacterium]
MQLLITSGPDASRAISLGDEGVLRVGRGVECEVRLNDAAMSRGQFELKVEAGRVWLRDAGSRFGTFVNGVKTAECELRPGDVIRAGETSFRVEAPLPDNRTTIAPMVERGMETPVRPFPCIPGAEEKTDGQECPSYGGNTVDPRRLAGRRFVRFEVKSIVAETQSGIVWRVWDTHLQTEAALKIFWPEQMAEPAAVARFLRAARTVLPLTHPNLVELYDSGQDEGLCWMASEFVDGENAAQLIHRIGIAGMLDWRQTLKIGVHVARALEFAAKHQIVHRKITPRCILVRRADGAAKLGGLGLAKSLDDDAAARVTRAGEIVGDLAYCSPEQSLGKHVDARSDLYNLGAALYALLTGRPPCEGRSLAETLDKIQIQTPEPPTKYHLAIPPLLEGVVLRLLAKRPQDRFDDAKSLLLDLERVAKYLGETALL